VSLPGLQRIAYIPSAEPGPLFAWAAKVENILRSVTHAQCADTLEGVGSFVASEYT